MEKNDRILIIGAGGLLGSAIVKKLQTSGYKTILSPTSEVLNCLEHESVNRYFTEHRPTFVFHLAAIVFGLKGNLNNQFLSLSQNTLINHNVLTTCKMFGIKKTFFAGTVASYAFPYAHLPLREEDLLLGAPHGGEFGYASSKRHALAYLEIMKADFGLDFVYGVFTNMYGPRDKFDTENGHVIPSLIRKAALSQDGGDPFEVWGNPQTTRDYMYSEDAAEAAIFLMNHSSGVNNIATGTSSTLGELVNAIRGSFPQLPATTWQSDMPVGIPKRSVSAHQLTRLGYKPAHTLTEGITATCQWYLQNQNSIRL